MPIAPLQALLGPLAVTDFFATHWEQRSLLCRGTGSAWPFAFDRTAFYEALPACAHVKVAYQDATGQHREAPTTAAQAPALFDAGLSLCAAGLEAGCAPLRQFTHALEDALVGSAFHFNGYLSPADKGFGIHFDNHSVWILQVEGTKRWFFADTPEIEAPISNCIYPLARPSVRLPWYRVPHPDGATLHEVVLEPGDVLYLPAGTWHKTQASGYSLSLTLAQQPLPAGRLITELLQQLAFQEASCRRLLPGLDADAFVPGTTPEALRDVLHESLAAMRRQLDALTADQVLDAWQARTALAHRKQRPAVAATT